MAIYPAVNPVHAESMAIEDMPISHQTYHLCLFAHPDYHRTVECYVLKGVDSCKHADEIFYRLTGFKTSTPKKKGKRMRVPVIKEDEPRQPTQYMEVELKQIHGQVHVLINGRIVANIYGDKVWVQQYALKNELGFKEVHLI